MKMLARAALGLAALLACAPAIAQVDPSLSGLPAASTITGTEILPVYQGGLPSATTLAAACSTHASFAGAPNITGLPGAGAITGSELVPLYQARQLAVSTVTAVCSTHAAFAGAPATTGLPGAGALTGPELVPLYQGGQRVAATITQIASFFGGAPPPSFTPSLDHSDARNSQYL